MAQHMAGPSQDGDGPTGLRFTVLGPVQVLVDGEPVTIGSPGARALLLLLLLSANQVVSFDRIVDGLWGDDPPATARTIVHGYISRVRRVLESVAGHSAQLLTRAPGYELRVDESRVDLFRARRLLDAARGQESGRRAELLRTAAALFRGAVPVNPPTDAVAVELAELRLVIIAERIEADLELGRHAELIGELRNLVRTHPFDEVLVSQLIRALYLAGQRADALETYRTFQRRVADELGIDPGPQLRELHESLLRDDPTLRETPASNGQSAPPQANPVVPAQLPPAASAFTGRDSELAWLNQLADDQDTVATTVAVITGAAGVGKSALAVTWGHRAVARFPDGVLFAGLRGFDADQPPLDVADVLPRFLLALGVRAADLPEELDEQGALYRSLLAARRVLVVLDDARDSEHVRPLLPGGSGSLVLVTSRRRLDGLVARSGARLLPLTTLAAGPATRLIARAAEGAGVPITVRQAADLARLCDHLPLALRVVAARLAVHPGRTVDNLLAELSDERTRLAALDLEDADTSVRAALDVSYHGLHPAIGSAFRMLGLVPGPTVDPFAVAALCGTDVVAARRRLRSLAEANLLAEAGAHRYLMHDLVRLHARGLAHTELSDTETADALDRLLDYYLCACDHARRLLHPPRDDVDLRARQPRIAMPTLVSAGQALDWFDAEWPNLSELLRATVSAGRHRHAWQLVLLTSHFLTTRSTYSDWSHWGLTGLASARADGDAEGEVLMLIVLATARSRYGHAAEALEDAESALGLATELGDPRHIYAALGNVGSCLYEQGRYREALHCDQESYRLAVRTGDLMAQAHALNNMSQVEREIGQRDPAMSHVRTAVALFDEIGDVGYRRLAMNNLIELCLEIGQLDEAETLARQALDAIGGERPDLQHAFTRELYGRVLLARGDAGATDELRAALVWSQRLDGPRSATVAELIASLDGPPGGPSRPSPDPSSGPDIGAGPTGSSHSALLV
ncbi:MAG TPA: BTAD domain-containing putative transcriptional regulator [Pseudonocardiaceae bacterium]|nr:BTAD domain-containing putative transcriptional regulator [Pseudonocardiaceae bacterium]